MTARRPPPQSFRLDPEALAALDRASAERGLSRAAVVSDALRQLSLPTTATRVNPLDTAVGVTAEPVDTSAPVWQLWTQPYVAWNPDALTAAKSTADQGNLELCADLWESMLGDSRISGALEQRILSSESLPLSYVGSPRAVRKLEALWRRMMVPGLRAELFRWGMGPGVCPVYVREWSEGEPVEVEVWHPRWLRYYFFERRWKIITQDGLINLDSQPGRWYLFCPFGRPLSRPWVTGLWYSLATEWLLKSYALVDLANFGQQHASPKWFMEVIEGNATISKTEKAQAIKWLARIPQRSSMFVPWPFKVSQHETNSSAWQSFIQAIDHSIAAFAQRILGHDASMDKDATHASGLTALDTKLSLVRYDVDSEREFWRQGLLSTWAQVNSIPGEVPYPDRDTTPPEDLKEASGTQKTAADALSVLVTAGYDSLLDTRAYLGRYFPLLDAETGAGDETAPTDGVQLDSRDLDALPEESTVRLSASGRVVMLKAGNGSRTDFPKQGDNEKVSLRNSRYDVFDPEYADSLKEDWPEIWKAGGNVRGNDQFRKLRPVAARGGAPEGRAEEDAVRLREAWAARHYGDHLLAGVVAQVKWLVVGELGEEGMKRVINAAKERKRKHAQSPRSEKRDVREQARDGLAYRDNVTDALLEEGLADAAAAKVLQVLSRSSGYDDARKRLREAFPTLDRERLRDLLTGALMLSQAAGRLTAGRETR